LALAPNYFSAARNLAQVDLAQNKPADARKRYEAILAKERKNVRAMIALGELAEREGKAEEYLAWLDKAAKADPSAIQPRQLLARYYVEHKQGDKALALAREAITTNPESAAALSLLGKTQLSLGENENALASFSKLVQQKPASADAYYHLGLAQRNLKRTDGARASMQRALEKQPAHLSAQEALIGLESASGRTEAALRLASAIQSQQPKSPLGLSLEGDIHMAARNYSGAARAFERASALGPSNTLAVKRHLALSLSGDDRAADNVVKQWLSGHPDDLFVHTYLARHYLLSGRDREAIATHEWLLKKAPRDVRLLNNLAWLYQKTGDARALPTAEEAHRLAPESPAVQDTLGWLLVQRGDALRGRELLAKAAGKSDSSSVRYHYAAALAQTGDKGKARLELERLLSSAKPFSERAQAEAMLKSL
jgi:putative PEP-CTERM system TPR-repeat lipoprotein